MVISDGKEVDIQSHCNYFPDNKIILSFGQEGVRRRSVHFEIILHGPTVERMNSMKSKKDEAMSRDKSQRRSVRGRCKGAELK